MTQIVTVNFRGTDLLAFHAGGFVFVALKPIVEGMGLDWSAQYRRAMRTPILVEGIAKMAIPFGSGGKQEMICLRMDLIHGWLFTINSTQVREELRERVELFQRECYDVLHAHFSGDREKLIREANETEALSLRLVTEARHIWGDRAAAQLWEKRGLPKVSAMDDVFKQLPLPLDYQQQKKAA